MTAPLQHAALNKHCHLPTLFLAVQWLPTVQIPYHETLGGKKWWRGRKTETNGM